MLLYNHIIEVCTCPTIIYIILSNIYNSNSNIYIYNIYIYEQMNKQILFTNIFYTFQQYILDVLLTTK